MRARAPAGQPVAAAVSSSIALSMNAGEIELQRTGGASRAPWSATDLVSMSTPPLDVAYAIMSCRPTRPKIDDRLTIDPPCRASSGRACLQPRNVPSRLTAITRLKLSTSVSAMVPRTKTPAALTRPARPRPDASIRPIIACQSSSRVTSKMCSIWAPPVRSQPIAWPPASRIARQIAAPMTPAAPVTRTGRSERRGTEARSGLVRPPAPAARMASGRPPGRAAQLPPAPMQPQPLLGVLAYPALDDRSDDLHRRLLVDAPLGVARRVDGACRRDPEAVLGEPHDAHADDRALVEPRQPRQQRVRQTFVPEERDRRALPVVLVDQHADVTPVLEDRPRHDHPLDARGDQLPHQPCADPLHLGGDAGVVRRAIDHPALEPVQGGQERGQLPVAQMCGKDHPGFAVVAQLVEHCRVVADDVTSVRMLPVEVPQAIEMRILANRPPQILPHAHQERVALGCRLFGERQGEVLPPDAVVPRQRSDPPHEACGPLRRPDRLE